MTQNTSSAVMAQRVEPPDSLDDFPTPPWATRALCEWLAKRYKIWDTRCWEPACGTGAMVGPLEEYFLSVDGSDIIITNPPFRLACDFATTAIKRADIGVGMLVRTQFLEGVTRYARLFSEHPPCVLQFTERVPMFKGRLDAKGSTATAYCWLVWTKDEARAGRIFWLPPCRKRLERPGDYDG